MSSADTVTNPTVYSEELWFKTTTGQGGKLIGFGDQPNGLSGGYDRHVYMEDSGKLVFGTWTGQTNTITSSDTYNDGTWHYLVARQDGNGMELFVDGASVGTNPQTQAQDYTGYWRVGGDNDWGGSSPWFNGTIDEVAVYSKALSNSDIASHYALGTGGNPPPTNHDPVAAFTSSTSNLTASFNGTGSSDQDGDSLTYSWNFGDGPTLGSGASPNHTYTSAGTYHVTLTVDDGKSGTNSITHDVTVTAGNHNPVAAFTSSTSNLTASFNGTGSSDQDGDSLTYSWNFGDGPTLGSGASPNHTYTSAGTYHVTLTVDDGKSGTNSITHDVTVTAGNHNPVAAFTSSTSNLTASFNGTGSSDQDGDSLTYSWNFGDGPTLGSGASPNHTYTSAGTYHVTLTVDDGKSGTNSITHDVTVTAPGGPTLLASDDFGGTVSSGWAPINPGGPWTLTGTKADFKEGSGVGTMTLSAKSATRTAALPGVSSQYGDLLVTASPQQLGTGAGTYVTLFGRVVGTASYQSTLVFKADGTVTLNLVRVQAGTSTTLVGTKVVPGLTYAAGDKINFRMQTLGTSPTTVRARVWKGGTEPTTWTASATDSTSALQAAGSIALSSYLSGSATTVPTAVTFDGLRFNDTGGQ